MNGPFFYCHTDLEMPNGISFLGILNLKPKKKILRQQNPNPCDK